MSRFMIKNHFFKSSKIPSSNSIKPNSSKILNLINPRPNPIIQTNQKTHLRLVENILETSFFQNGPQQNDPFYRFLVMYRQGTISSNPGTISQALSFCASERSPYAGIQIHCFAIKIGLIPNIYVGSSLISFYGKIGELGYSCNVFDEMPERNVVSWTALICAHAREGKVDICLELYGRMRNTVNPNDLTLTSLLSVCAQSGSFAQGYIAHCQAIRMGLDSYLSVSNVLVSMYCKFGDLEKALLIFEEIKYKDVVSWSSMINGYSQHGLATKALDLFEKMKLKGVNPDAITFLGVLSSCRHMGLVEQGQFHFNSMSKFGLKPKIDHYSCVVDLLARSGDLKKALDFIKNMPMDPNAVIWGSILSSCRIYGDVWIGIEAAENKLVLEPYCGATHLQLVKLYASVGYWDEVAKLRKLMKDRGLKTDTGYSWIEIKNDVYRFRADDSLDSKMDVIIDLVDCLMDHMRKPCS